MNKISLALIKIVLFGAIITATELVAMEKDEDSSGNSSPQGFIRQIHPAFTPVFSEKFDCFLRPKVKTSDDLMCQHSKLIRTTIHNVISIIKFSSLYTTLQQFDELKRAVERCAAIGKMWGHPSLPLFEDIQQLYSKHFLKDPVALKEKLSEIVLAPSKLKSDSLSVDSLELKLLSMAYEDQPVAFKVVEISQLLAGKRRPKLAVYYLLAFARKVPNLKTGRWLCENARDIEATYTVKFDSEQVSISESRQAEEQLKAFMLAETMLIRKDTSDNVLALEAALRCLPQGVADTKMIFKLTDRLALQGRQDIAIHYLLGFAEQHSGKFYATAMECYKKAARLGSLEAKKKEWQFQLENPSGACDDLINFKPEYLESLKSGHVYTFQELDELSSSLVERYSPLPVVNVYGALQSYSEEEKEIDS
jgi:hypothetical protein